MFRNYITTALRNLARNRLYTAINVLGLALGIAASLLALLYVRHELSYERFIPNHDNIYVAVSRITVQGQAPRNTDGSAAALPTWVKSEIADVQAARQQRREVSLRHGDVEFMEQTAWADPDFFSVLKVPVVAGDLAHALDRPDSLVLTRRMARKYFGEDAPLGKTLEVNRAEILQVTAVIEDLPTTTTLIHEIYGSGRNSAYGLADRFPERAENFLTPVNTFFAVSPATSIETLRATMPDLMERRFNAPAVAMGLAARMDTDLVPLPDFYLHPIDVGPIKHGSATAVFAIAAAGLLIIVIAAINFVNLMTARAMRRAVEVGVRKVSGAEALQLRIQFIGEAVLYAMLAAALAVASVGLILPAIDGGLVPGIREQWTLATALLAPLALAAVVGVLSGVYPAFVLSAFRPAVVLKSAERTTGKGALRQSLVMLQFGVLVVLVLATVLVYRQTAFSLREGLRFPQDQMLLVYAHCRSAFVDQLKAIPEVRGVACANRDPLNNNPSGFVPVTRPGGSQMFLGVSMAGFGLLELYGIAPVAGRLFDPVRDAERLNVAAEKSPVVLLNESAARALGFASPDAAIGERLSSIQGKDLPMPEVIGVVPDFTFDLMTMAIPPTIYTVGVPANSTSNVLNVKLTGRAIPETLERIDAVWKQFGEPRPIHRQFLDQHLQERYLGVIRQGTLIGSFATAAIIIAALGLFGLSTFIAEQRTKEIGIRKSMGATQGDILRLILWQFAKPVLLANLIAWPVAYVIMQRWLEGFAYHVDLAPWMFLAASALALAIALATVLGHALLVARAQPVAALRYE